MSHLNMTIPLAQRLADRKAEKPWRNYSQAMSPGTRGGNDIGKREQSCAWFDTLAALKSTWRFVGYADKIIRLRHEGWWTDNFQDGLCRGIVAQVPGRAGEPVFLPGFVCTGEDTICVLAEPTNDKEDAAHWADGAAERYAEQSREGDAKSLAEAQIEDLTCANDDALYNIRQLRRELAAVRACGHAVAADTLRKAIRAAARSIRANRKRIEALEENYWSAVE